ncbi:2-oxoglutarate dehydrogenase complex dihydrolipoyllysine-residue succinyltransferase [Sulfuriroseicoccus oceanibius]|uniref:Dihydrolipoyllysine-residue succinyltransferase n=1 Tax=Sulfuriroseicoccus oceanibius TaxID=2707525 RepID=A0A6B3L867_9BACT|nr:2-oxoglutarate dehydrogenase complex dihydrolipoyllysine-residue succinyltransferase [Sulfuriroseicoccus oceanibius]QQL44369.1 2-oxoglutarate dehydrogenase complex dihydrolipoyllysine-residue succinyltransferase [Sulfuriroseicoccus oceanibius]
MSFEVKIPAAGESVTSATVGEWHKESGDAVSPGDVLVTLETDKVSQELEAEVSGVLTIVVEEGEDCEIGTVIATIEEGEGAESAPAAEEPKDSEPESEEKSEEKSEAAAGEEKKPEPKAESKPEPKAAPAADKRPNFAALANATPSSEKPSAPVVDAEGRVTRKKMSPLRRKIASHLVNAQQTAAILTTFNEVDMSAVMNLRKSLQPDFVEKHGVKLGFMSFFVKAVVEALKSVPAVNGSIEGNEIVQNHFYDIGVAIGTEKGLVVPVLRDCDKKSFAEIERDIIDYAQKAQSGALQMSDLQGGVFTVSNGGTYGSLLSTPILNPPQSGILGMHTIQQRPVAVDGKVEIRPMMYLAMSYDHRLIDGKEAVTFLIRIKECIEQPTRLLVGV